MFPSRAGCASHGPATGEREPPGHAPHGARPPERRGEPPEHGRDKEKREVHTHRPPEQRRGKPQQAGERTPADSRGIEPHPHNVSEPLSRRTQRPRGITVQKRGNKTSNTKRTQDAQQEPAHHPPKRRTPTPHGRNQPLGYTPQCRPQHAHTRAHIQPFRFPLVPVAGVEPARPYGRRILSALCLPISSDWHR